jgi:hypothetical protein
MPIVARLTSKQIAFIKKHGFENPIDWSIDASGMTRVQFREALRRERRLFAYGLSPCPRGHTMRMAGGCPECDTSYIAYAKRSRLPGYIYIAKSGRLTKVGFSRDALNRLYIANLEGYAGEYNWRIRARVYSSTAGQKEFAVHRLLNSYRHRRAWERNGVELSPREVFNCTYDTAHAALISVLTASEALAIEEF